MTRSSNTRKAKKAAAKAAADSKVVPLHAKQGLKLTETERMGIENIQLKMQLVDTRAAAEKAPLLAAQKIIAEGVNKRLKIDLQAYSVDIDTGELVPLNGGPAEPPATETPDETKTPDPVGAATPDTDPTPPVGQETTGDGDAEPEKNETETGSDDAGETETGTEPETPAASE